MGGGLRSEELFAEEVLRRVLGIHVTQRDDGSRRRMADALFQLPNGGEGALENIDKLRATSRAELHLFLRIHDTAMPFSLYYPLAWGAYVPAAPLNAPEGLTGLWLAPASKNPILWWSAEAWWRREDCFDCGSSMGR